MFRLTADDFSVIALSLACFLYGVYSGIFAIYLQYQGSKKDTNKTQNVIMYSICTLYVLSVTLLASDIVQLALKTSEDSLLHIYIAQNTLFGCCDFIAQFILIYRCWIVWRYNIRIIIIPSTLAFAFLVIWLVTGGLTSTSSKDLVVPDWAFWMTVLALALSLTVNSLVTGLIIFRIFKVFREVRATSDHQILDAPSGNKLRDVIFILIESGMALFAIQLVRVVISLVGTQGAIDIVIGVHEMFTGITPTIILVRTSMGLSFDEDKSMEEVATESLHIASNHLNSIHETGRNNVVEEDSRDDDDIGIRQDNDIEIVGR